MAGIAVHADVELDSPTLVEGLPGVGLVGKIATDHLIAQLDMTYFGTVRCDGLPRISVYKPGERAVHPPVRLYADAEHDLLALQSEVPVSTEAAPGFADCVSEWLAANDVTPTYLSGYGTDERSTPPELFGVTAGTDGDAVGNDAAGEDAGGADADAGSADADLDARLQSLGVDRPTEQGAVSGPTGALLAAADERGLDAVGLVVEADPQFPDPAAARVLLERGVAPLADVELDLDPLVEQAEEIRETRQQLAQSIQQAEEDASSEAKPLRMFQ